MAISEERMALAEKVIACADDLVSNHMALVQARRILGPWPPVYEAYGALVWALIEYGQSAPIEGFTKDIELATPHPTGAEDENSHA